jgi:hypothetical protein
MSKQLLILPKTYKDNLNQEDQKIINKILSKYEVFTSKKILTKK